MSANKKHYAFALVLVLIATLAKAQDDPMVSVEVQTAFREKVLGYVLLVTVTPNVQPFLDPAFVPKRHGLAVRVETSSGPKVLTSAALFTDAEKVVVGLPSNEHNNMPGEAVMLSDGTAELKCGTCINGPKASPASIGACDPNQTVFGVVPAGAERFAVISTVVAARGDPLPSDMALVHGRLPEGTPLFDAQGRLACIVVRLATDGSRSLAVPFVPRKPKEAEPKP